MNSKIRKVVQRTIVYYGQHIHLLVYEDNNEIVDFENIEIWSDIENMK